MFCGTSDIAGCSDSGSKSTTRLVARMVGTNAACVWRDPGVRSQSVNLEILRMAEMWLQLP
jgi:hypothetical protein